MLDRSAWETVWAVADGYYGFGQVLGERLNPAETNFAIYESTLPPAFWPLVTLVFAALYGLIFIRPADYSQPRNMVALTGVTVSLFLLYSKGYSPQFLVYLLPFIILLFPDGRGLAYALMLTGLNVLEQPIYFVLLPQATWLLIFIVIARFGLISLLILQFVTILWPEGRWLAPLVRLQPRMPLILGSLSAVVLLILSPLLVWAYTTGRVTDSPLGTFVGFMKAYPQPAASCLADRDDVPLFVSDQATYQALYPYLRGDADLQLTAGAPQQSDFPRPAEFLPRSGLAWVLPTGPQARTLGNAAANRGRTLATLNFGEVGTASLYDFTPGSSARPCPVIARYDSDLELLTYETDVSRGSVTVTLYWRILAPQTRELTVFTQLLNAQGQQVAGHDSLPRNGTAPLTTWPIETIQADSHRLELPANLPPGQYQLIAGLYNSGGERIRSTDAQGVAQPNRATTLETLSLP
jgi:hypothetical protein